ncbi:hypothetical protein J4558_00070 [Leptolyngbya sp. 15MV]|nr:hypothetical protein J4558_00070 [Leptolyngbya sp. 15MV]
MTVQSPTSRVAHVGNGVSVAFAVPFRTLDPSHLAVFRRAPDAAEEEPVAPSEYTTSGLDGPTGGTLTFLAAPAAGVIISIIRRLPAVQLTDYQEGDPFPAETHERALDYLTMIAAEHADRLGRVFVLSETDQPAALVLPTREERANRFLAFDEDGNAIAADGGGGGALIVSSFSRTLLPLANEAQWRGGIGAAAAADLAAALADIIALGGEIDGLQARRVDGADSIQGGGPLGTADIALRLIGDESAPAASRYYGTSAGGVRGWHPLPTAPVGWQQWTLTHEATVTTPVSAVIVPLPAVTERRLVRVQVRGYNRDTSSGSITLACDVSLDGGGTWLTSRLSTVPSNSGGLLVAGANVPFISLSPTTMRTANHGNADIDWTLLPAPGVAAFSYSAWGTYTSTNVVPYGERLSGGVTLNTSGGALGTAIAMPTHLRLRFTDNGNISAGSLVRVLREA